MLFYILPMPISKILSKTTALAVVLWGISAFAEQNVLILNSYNPSFARTNEITKAILSVLTESNSVNTYIEYIDVLTMASKDKEKYELGFYTMLKQKYVNVNFNMMITIDNTAFNFAKQYRDKLWEKIPIVSCGMSMKQAESVKSDSSLWFGIYEFHDVPAQINFIYLVQPNIKKIVFITDETESGLDISEQLNLSFVANQSNIDLEEWVNPSWESIPELLSHLNPKHDAVVLAGMDLNDSIKNTQRLWQTVTKYISDSSKVPVYTFWDAGVQNGVVGGNVTFASLMGKNTGLLAAAVLAENENYAFGFQKNAELPIIDEQIAMAKNLRLDKLPPETIKINMVETWLNKYQEYMSNLENAIRAAVLAIVLLALSFYAYFRYSNRKLLREMTAVARANKAKILFLANMSHEIKTPLNSILGFSQLLSKQSTNLSEEQKDWCQSIETSTYHLRDTINNILDYSKMETEHLKIEEEWVDIFLLCDELISVSRHYLFYKNIRLYVMPSINLPKFIKTDYVRLKQVLINLVNNALKFTDEGSVTLAINYIDKQKIYFEVVDTGIGIQKEKIKKIFNAFEQAEMGNSRKYSGSGLGLAISQNILQAMGSNLEVRSKEKKGSVFYFLLSTKVREEGFYKRFFNRENQHVAVYHSDQKVFEYLGESVIAAGGFASPSSDIREILNMDNQDLLIAEADELTDFHLQSISTKFPKVMLLFYKKNERISMIKRDYPKFECVLTPVKNEDLVNAIKILYG